MKTFAAVLFAVISLNSAFTQASVRFVCDFSNLKEGSYRTNSVQAESQEEISRISNHFRGDVVEIEITQTLVPTISGSRRTILSPAVRTDDIHENSEDVVGTMRILKNGNEVVRSTIAANGYTSGVDNSQSIRGGSAILTGSIEGLEFRSAFRVLRVFIDGAGAGFIECEEE